LNAFPDDIQNASLVKALDGAGIKAYGGRARHHVGASDIRLGARPVCGPPGIFQEIVVASIIVDECLIATGKPSRPGVDEPGIQAVVIFLPDEDHHREGTRIDGFLGEAGIAKIGNYLDAGDDDKVPGFKAERGGGEPAAFQDIA